MIPLRDLNPSKRFPVVTVTLIAVNAALFVYELWLGARLDGFLMQSAFIPAKALEATGPGTGLGFGVTSGLLSMFLHGGIAHFLGNMMFLWIFGDNVEDLLGRFRYLIFYLLCGYAATYAHALTNPASTVPTIGASGAIAGVLGAYVVLFPKARIVTLLTLGFFFQTVEIPALVYLGLWFVLQAFSGAMSLRGPEAAGGVAWFAHIGGFVVGPLLFFLFGGRRPERQDRFVLPPPRMRY